MRQHRGMTADAGRLADIAERAARAAGEILRDRFRAPAAGVGAKSAPTDLVSDADRRAEEAIAAVLARDCPDDGLLGEEGSTREGTSGRRWVVDPLDGTINYLWGLPQWAVSVGVEDEAGGLAGVVYDPSRDELFRAVRDGPATGPRGPLAVRDEGRLAEALVVTGFNYDAGERDRQAERLTRIVTRVRDIRRLGAAALDLAWLADGRVDGYFETGVAPWDIAAGTVLVEAAGGAVRPLAARDGSPPGIIAASRGLIDDLEALVLGSYGAPGR